MRRGLALALVAVAACRGGARKVIARSSDGGPAVQLVDRSGTPGGGAATAASNRPPEREPDDDVGAAMPLGDDGVRGTLDGSADVDTYAITSAGARLLTARLTAMPGIDAKLELRDESFAVIATSDRGGAGVGEGLPNISLDRGNYFLVVREIEHGKKKGKVDGGVGRVGPSPAYQLTASQATDPPAGGEREPDDDTGTANELTLASPVTGYLGWKGDVDAWKLAIDGLADGDGLDVTVTAVDKVALTVEIVDAAGRRLVKQSGVAGAPLALRSLVPRVTVGEPTVQFVLVSGGPPNPDATYSLTVTSRLLDLDEEAEPNDVADRANPLRFGTEDTGTMRGELGPGEVDRFVLSPGPTDARLDVVVDPPPGVDVTIGLDGGATGQGGRQGDRTQLTDAVVTAHQAVVVTVSGKASKTAARGPYQLRWSLTAAAAAAPPTAPDDGDDPLPPEEP